MTQSANAGAGRPLTGMKVIDFGQYIAGPGAGMVLAELGADVIKVEPPAGDAARGIGPMGQSMVRAYNRNKRSIAIDLADPRGSAAVMRLIADADVVIQNLRPGVIEKFGLGPAQVRALHPRVIYLSVTGFGRNGPSANRPGFDIAAQAESGMMSMIGDPDGTPHKVGSPIIDSTTAHLGAQAVLAALLQRARTGVGDTIEASLLGTAMHLMLPSWGWYLNGGPEPRRVGNGQPAAAPAADIVRTADGQIVLSAFTDDHWARLCKAIGRPEMVADPRFATNAQRVANRAAMHEILGECLSHSTSEECVRLLAEQQIVVGAVRGFAQARDSADVVANGLIADVEPRGDEPGYRTLRLPYTMAESPVPATRAAPRLGEHGTEVLLEAGFTRDEVDALRAAGVLRP